MAWASPAIPRRRNRLCYRTACRQWWGRTVSRASAFSPPEIVDEDVVWVAQMLGLPAHAFTGPDGHDPRLTILKSVEALDVEACPGSGKTTLLVAKLAILARKWTEARRGICILSHTNVA